MPPELLAQLLSIGVQTFAAYRHHRDAALAAGIVTPGDVLTDGQLVDLFSQDAATLLTHAQAALAKWQTALPPKG